MTRLTASTFLGAALALASAAAAASADVVADLQPGQSFVGDVPPGETVRLTVRLAQDAKLRLQFTLQLSSADFYIPANFQRVSVIGPDGTPVALDRQYLDARYDSKGRRSTFYIKDWPAPAPGNYTISVTHRTQVGSTCKGQVAARRRLRTPIAGDETTPTFSIPLAPDDRVQMIVRRKSGTAPFVAGYTAPGGVEFEPRQRRTKKGSTTSVLSGYDFGSATFRVGYQEPSQATGAFTGTIVLKPYVYKPGSGRVSLYVGNPPGVPLSVRDPDAFVDATFAKKGAGVASDGTYVLVTGEDAGQVLGRLYGTDLIDPNPFGPSNVLATSGGSGSDLSPGETISGHRLLFTGGAYYLAVSSATGRSAALARINPSLSRTGFTPVVEGPNEHTNDLFLATDGLSISVGIPSPPNAHKVYLFDAAQMKAVGAPVGIGGASWPQAAASSAAFRADQGIYEFWTPETSAYGVPSNLHHTLYSPTWGAITADEKPLADANVVQTFPTSVIVDDQTGATVVHWIELNQGYANLGLLHRAVFDAVGKLVPGSEATLGTALRNRPTGFIAGGFLYLATEGPSNAFVARYRLLR